MSTTELAGAQPHQTQVDGSSEAGFLADVISGLSQPQKRLQSKYFYDAAGSALFDRICELPEYYPTRTELAIMRDNVRAIAAGLPAGCVLIEYGSGSSTKTRLLLDHLEAPACYAPVDISGAHLLKASRGIAQAYPHIPVLPIHADFTQPFELSPEIQTHAPRVVYFPGSTLGNFTSPSDLALLGNMAALARPGGHAVVGLDLQKAPEVLEAAYNDSQGVTAAFNLNLLAHINSALGADFNLDAFAHRAIYNRAKGRIEMYLDSLVAQTVHVGGHSVAFKAGEAINTEYSVKYTVEGFTELASRVGLRVDRVFTDAQRYFAVVCLRVEAGAKTQLA